MSSIWVSVSVAAIAAVANAAILGVIHLKAQRQRNAAEQQRWQAVERLTANHGPEVLTHLPQLARELRELPEPVAPMRRRGGEPPAGVPSMTGRRGRPGSAPRHERAGPATTREHSSPRGN